MSLIETVKDYEFADSIRRLANAADSIAEELEKANKADSLNDEQVKEIIKSYPKEDLLELLNYDQKEYIKDMINYEHVKEDMAALLEDDEYMLMLKDISEDKEDKILHKAAERMAILHKTDSNEGYFTNCRTNLNYIIEEVL